MCYVSMIGFMEKNTDDDDDKNCVILIFLKIWECVTVLQYL